MRDWDIPLTELIARIKYETDNSTGAINAFLDGQLIGNLEPLGAKNEKILEEFKRHVIKRIAQWSATIQLKTRCGCTNVLSQPGVKNELVVPLPPSAIDMMNESDWRKQQGERRFYYRGKLSEIGIRVFEER
jgi:hypothetical protein